MNAIKITIATKSLLLVTKDDSRIRNMEEQIYKANREHLTKWRKEVLSINTLNIN